VSPGQVPRNREPGEHEPTRDVLQVARGQPSSASSSA
jgi:hypothetical protein